MEGSVVKGFHKNLLSQGCYMSKYSRNVDKIPRIRFPEFNSEWEEKKLGDIVKVERGGSPRPIEEYITENEGIPWIKIGDLPRSSKYVTSTQEKIRKEGVSSSREVYPGDFILSNSMSFGRPYIVKIYGCIHDGWLALRNAKRDNVTDDFLYELLQTDSIKQQFLSFAAGSAVKNLKSETVKTAIVNLPTIQEQQKIASFLSSVDEWINNLKEQKELLQQYKKGMMQKIFSQEIRFKDENGNKFPEWEEKKLGEVATFRNGKAHEQHISEGGEYIVVNSKFVSTNGIIKKYSNLQISPLYIDDITIVMSDIPNGKALGKCFLIREDNRYTLNQRIGAVRSNTVISSFLIKIINRHPYFLTFNNGVSQTNLRKEEVLDCPIHFPSDHEQYKIASFLTSIDAMIDEKVEQINQAEVWKKGLIQGLFV